MQCTECVSHRLHSRQRFLGGIEAMSGSEDVALSDKNPRTTDPETVSPRMTHRHQPGEVSILKEEEGNGWLYFIRSSN